MNIVHLTQGSPEWHAHRLQHFNASDAPAMMGCSPYKTRTELIRELATGLREEVTADQQRRYDDGHRYEVLARPLAEDIIDEELAPVVGTSGRLSASFDGLTLMNDTAWEHKSLNDALRAVLPVAGVGDESVGASLPPVYRVQMEQQCMVSGCDRVLFTASKWQGNELIEARHCWYEPDLELRAQIIGGWVQLEADVAAYVPPAAAAPAAIAEPVEHLPAVVVSVSGEIEVTANFKPFEAKLRDFLDNKLIRSPKTDQDFVDLDAQIKAMKAGRDALKGAKGQMLGGVQPVDQAVKTIDMLDDLLQKACSAAERTLKDEKERRKSEIVEEHRTKLREHCAALSARVGVPVTAAADFAGVIKGLKTLDSMENKLSVELARAKIEANSVADLIDANRKAMDAADAAGLFPDFGAVCTKPADDFANLIASRRAVAEQRLQAERERIRAEEAARVEREAAARQAQQAREEAAAQAQRDAEARAEQQRQADAAEAERRRNAATIGHSDYQPLPVESIAAAVAAQSRTAAPAPEVRHFPTRTAAPAVNEEPTLTLGRISSLLGFTVTADLLGRLGFTAHVVKAARLYRPSQFPAIKRALVEHIESVPDEVPLAA